MRWAERQSFAYQNVQPELPPPMRERGPSLTPELFRMAAAMKRRARPHLSQRKHHGCCAKTPSSALSVPAPARRLEAAKGVAAMRRKSQLAAREAEANNANSTPEEQSRAAAYRAAVARAQARGPPA